MKQLYINGAPPPDAPIENVGAVWVQKADSDDLSEHRLNHRQLSL
jgi:hypothetical protein